MLTKSFFEPRENETIGDVAYRRIKSDIIRGYLKPGEKLKIDALKERYAVGVSTVREILTRLWVEQLIHAEGQRGFEVAGRVTGGSARRGGPAIVAGNTGAAPIHRRR